MAELKLRVSLDTSYLKGQISRLPLEFAGANVSIRPKFDRQTIVNEFRLLNRYISSKKFNIVINTNLNKEIENADRLVKALGRVQQAASGAKGGLPIGTQVLSRTKSKGGFAAAEIKTLFGAAVQGGLIDEKTLAATRAQMVAALGSIGRDSIAGLLNGLKSGDADIQNAAKFLGNNLITSFKTVLGIASPSREFKKIGESAGQGFEQGLLKSIEIAEQSATRKMQRMLDRLARMALMMGGMSGPEIGRQVAQARGLPALNFGATTPRASVGIGPSSSGRMLSAAPSRTAIAGAPAPAGLLPSLSSAGQSKAIIEALIASTGPRLLPSGGGDDSLGKLAAPRQTKDAVDAILRNYFKVVEAQVKEVFSAPPIKKESLNIFDHLDTEQYFNYLAQARVNAENAIKQRIEEAKQVTKQNQIKDAAQSFLRALEETVRNAERSVFTQSRIAANASYVQRANVREVGQPLLGGRQGAAPKMLSAATGFYRGAATPPSLPETQAQLFARREREARMRSVLRGVDVMGETSTRAPARYSYANRPAMPRRPTSAIVPYESGGALVPSGGGGGGAPPMPPRGGGGSFGGMQFNVPKLPGAGLVREIGEEFGFAAKQVLLFGTAYKALAFIQGFPAQVGEAVGALQSFRNTIKEISPSAEEAAESSQFILDIVDKYNTPIQSARDGFTKLYASMKPTGFSGDEIRDLFLGISQAAATFGMSAEKVDRVNYAFAQMASKGQVMSEELKGQLGDVLPGAMGIFAKAAGFKGPDAITKFSKALEDGAYKGGAMKTLLTNVGSIMRKEFGPGAEGAARTFQGVMNRMQNSTKLLYEAFEPAAVGFLNSVVMPLTSGLKTVTDGFNAFFTGANAKTSGGFAFAQELEKLRPTLEGLRTNAIGLAQVFGEFAKVALGVGSALLQIAGNPIVGFMAKIYAIIVPLNMVLGVMRGLWALNSLQLLLFNARVAMGVPTLSAFRGMMQATGVTAAVTATSIRTAGLTLRTFFASTGVGLILVGISLLIERFMSMNQALADTRAKALGAATAIRAMSQTEAVLEERKANSGIKLIEKLQSRKPSYEGSEDVSLTESEASSLEALGIPVNKGVGGGRYMNQSKLEGHRQNLETVNVAESQHRQRVIKDEENKAQQAATITPIAGVAADGTDAQRAADKARQEAEKRLQQEQQRAIELSNHENARAKINFDRKIQLDDSAFEHERSLIDALNEYRLSGLNDMQARQEKVVQDLKKIQLDAVDTVRKATQKAQEAQLNVVTAQRTAAAAGTGAPLAPALPPPSGAGSRRLPGSISGRLDASGQNGADMPVGSNNAIQSYHNGLVKAIGTAGNNGNYIVIDFIDDLGNRLEATYSHVAAGVRQGQSVVGGQTIGRFDASGRTTGPHNSVDINSLGNNGSFQRNQETSAARRSADLLVTGRVQGSVGSSAAGPSASGASFRMETKQQTEGFDLIEAKAKRSAAIELQRIGMQRAVELAYVKTASVIKTNIDTIFPVEKQKLDLRLQQMRQSLLMQGMPEEYINYEMNRAAAMEESAIATKNMETSLASAKAELAVYNDAGKKGVELTIEQKARMGHLKKEVEGYEAGLASLTEKQKAYNIAALESAIASIKNADALKAQQEAISLVDGNVQSATSSYKNFVKEVARGGDPKEALKKFQDSITDQVLTVFLDYAFKPVEDFFKDALKNIFGLPTEEKQRQEVLAKLEAQLAKQERIAIATEQTAINTAPGAAGGQDQSTGLASAIKGIGLSSGIDTSLSGIGGAPMPGFDAASVFGDPEALTGAFAGIQSSIGESMNGIVSSFERGAFGLSSALPAWSDALVTDIPDTLKQSSDNTGTEGGKFQESLGKVTAGIGIAAGAIMGIAAGISQIKEGGTSNVLGGIGSILLGVAGGISGFASLGKAANGAVWKGGFQAFANGGMVSGPTLGLIGEGKYNEAIVPLPDGRSIPVQFNQQSSLREAMAGGSNNTSAPSVLNMSFESTNINGVEYVSRDQLEQAMAQTRKQASRDGANRGMTMTLDKLQQSPSTRSRLGMR